jgi:hypothetical protein
MATRNVDLNRIATISATQGAADAFKESSVSTGLSTASNFAWLLKRITFQISGSSLLVAAAMEIQMAISRTTQASMPNLTDTEVICIRQQYCSLLTSGASWIEGVIDWEAPTGTLVVQPDLYLDIDSTNTGNAQTVIARVHYDLVELSRVDFLSQLVAS